MEVYEKVLATIQELEVEFKNTQIMAENIGHCLPKLHAMAQDLNFIKTCIFDLRATAAETCHNPNIIKKDNKEYTT